MESCTPSRTSQLIFQSPPSLSSRIAPPSWLCSELHRQEGQDQGPRAFPEGRRTMHCSRERMGVWSLMVDRVHQLYEKLGYLLGCFSLILLCTPFCDCNWVLQNLLDRVLFVLFQPLHLSRCFANPMVLINVNPPPPNSASQHSIS